MVDQRTGQGHAVLECAARSVGQRWGLSPRAARNAVVDTAAELGIDAFDLAALIAAAEAPGRSEPRPSSAG